MPAEGRAPSRLGKVLADPRLEPGRPDALAQHSPPRAPAAARTSRRTRRRSPPRFGRQQWGGEMKTEFQRLEDQLERALEGVTQHNLYHAGQMVGQGIRQKAIGLALEKIRTIPGLRVVRLHVQQDNLWAIRCYESCGLRSYRRALAREAVQPSSSSEWRSSWRRNPGHRVHDPAVLFPWNRISAEGPSEFPIPQEEQSWRSSSCGT